MEIAVKMVDIRPDGFQIIVREDKPLAVVTVANGCSVGFTANSTDMASWPKIP